MPVQPWENFSEWMRHLTTGKLLFPDQAPSEAPVATMGVSLQYLVKITTVLEEMGLEDETTAGVVAKVIAPATAKRKGRFHDMIPRYCTGKPDYHIIHCWDGGDFFDMIDSIRVTIKANGDDRHAQDIFVWFDWVALSPHTSLNTLCDLSDVKELAINCKQALHQLCTSVAPALHQLCTSFAPALHQLCTSFAPALHHLCTSVAPALHQLCTSFAPALHQLCTSFAPALHQLCTSVAPALHQLCTSFAPALHQRCTSFAPALHQPEYDEYLPALALKKIASISLPKADCTRTQDHVKAGVGISRFSKRLIEVLPLRFRVTFRWSEDKRMVYMYCLALIKLKEYGHLQQVLCQIEELGGNQDTLLIIRNEFNERMQRTGQALSEKDFVDVLGQGGFDRAEAHEEGRALPAAIKAVPLEKSVLKENLVKFLEHLHYHRHLDLAERMQ
eukprot:gene28032-31132_t